MNEIKSTYYYLDGTIDHSYDDPNKLLHRLDGPALEVLWEDGSITTRYFLYDEFLGENLTPKKWIKIKNKFLKEYIFK